MKDMGEMCKMHKLRCHLCVFLCVYIEFYLQGPICVQLSAVLSLLAIAVYPVYVVWYHLQTSWTMNVTCILTGLHDMVTKRGQCVSAYSLISGGHQQRPTERIE